jgi:hypothetical protein
MADSKAGSVWRQTPNADEELDGLPDVASPKRIVSFLGEFQSGFKNSAWRNEAEVGSRSC